MKKLSVLFLIFAIFLNFTAGFVSAAEVIDPGAAIMSCHGIDANSTMLGTNKITENVRSAFLYEANSETLMYAYEPDRPMHPASLVKILSGLVAVELGDLDDVVTVSESALSSVPHDAVSANLKVGEQMKLIDLIYCMVVASANDAAVVVAEYICGNQDEFVVKMNQYAKEIGCTGSNFTNVHGMHHDEQITTARDVARILDKALRNETFRTIFTSKQHRIEETNMSASRRVGSNNALLDPIEKQYYDKRVVGGRNAVTEDGRRCLAAAAENNGMLLISVVMGTESVYQEDGYSAISVGGYFETTALLDAGFKGYKATQIMYADQPLQQCKVAGGDCDLVIGPKDSVLSVVPEDATADNLSYRFSVGNLTAPIEKGQKITDVQIWSGSMCVAQTELFAMNSVDVKTETDSYLPAGEEGSGAGKIILIILAIPVCLIVIFGILRFAKRIPVFRAKKRSAQYRRSHRRSR